MDRFFRIYRTTIDFREVIFHLAITAMLCFLIGLLYVSLNSRRSDHLRLARLFPLLGMGMALVATILGSSLAIAIGLVGTMSIVRFRAVISGLEPLSFLFLTIAIGLAGGTGQLAVAALALLLIAAVLYLRYWLQGRQPVPMHLHISGATTKVFALLPKLQSAFPKLQMQQAQVGKTQAEWRFSLPLNGPKEVLALHAFLSASAHGLQFSLSDAVETA
ncbi:MAG TPA: DUF4956 domain-containing protein [Bacteroidetes bacterium]|nr:DUF4956 domain-containing protein [Bacteroidota bacterium]